MKLGRSLTSTIFVLWFLVMNAVAANMRAPEFELKDQYGNSQAYRFPNGRVNVLIFGDRKGSGQIEAWVRPLYDRYQDRINIKGIAALSSVPSMARGMVTRIFKSQVKYPVLLDWTGDVTKSYGYEAGKANVFVVSPNGDILLRINGAATPQGLDQVKAQVSRALGEK
ncbi:MAG: redoxin domain-containing protein [Blastocatellia bacterium]|nr:redoxin domain-containing protein [Blastocatellia bacterium]